MPKLWQKTEEYINALLPQSVLFINRLPLVRTPSLVGVCTDHFGECERWSAAGFPAALTDPASFPNAKNLDVCCVALRKGRDNQLADIAFGWNRLAAAGTLLICGYNDEGIRAIETVAKKQGIASRQVVSKGGGRTLEWKRQPTHDALIASWWEASQTPAIIQETVAGVSFSFASLPGTFAGGKLDDGTRALLQALPVKLREPILDFACGGGAVAAFVAARGQKNITMSDVSAQAIRSARLTAQLAQIAPPLLSDRYQHIKGKFGTILLNPPFHQGVATEYDTARTMILDGGRHLKGTGRMILVANLFLPYEALCREHNIGWRVLTEDSRFKVLELRYHQAEVEEPQEDGVETVPEELWAEYYRQAKLLEP
ncbi:class I SAM-dependent methyltransferase [Chrysiogenes arsenatis]|uniref:class I SAM-dependent methyltransferase n=1 Tax=Chrysiogenes arsenatis TaxID=309797 RepID=UPI000414A205|nr:methyltransferase [Chrysiogenes arsenatis]